MSSDEHESSEGDCDILPGELSPDVFWSDEHESSEGDCDLLAAFHHDVRQLSQMSMNPRKGTVTDVPVFGSCV